jgi:hypothetical protein
MFLIWCSDVFGVVIQSFNQPAYAYQIVELNDSESQKNNHS